MILCWTGVPLRRRRADAGEPWVLTDLLTIRHAQPRPPPHAGDMRPLTPRQCHEPDVNGMEEVRGSNFLSSTHLTNQAIHRRARIGDSS